MNSTIWVTLSNFVQYLGRTNQCTIDKTPKGWYITYVDNTPEAKMRAEAKANLDTNEMTAEQRHERDLARQIEDCRKEGGFQESEFTELQREEGDAPISFNMASKSSSSSSSSAAASIAASASANAAAATARKGNVLEDAFASHETVKGSKEGEKRKLSAVEQLRLEHEASKRQKTEAEDDSPSESPSGSEPWLTAGLVVKVMNQDLAGGKYYRKKAKVEKVRQQFTADVRMVEAKDLIRLDQEMLETVIPNVGKPVVIVKGSHKGKRATMSAVNFEGFCVSVKLEDGTVMEGLRYDEVCKFED